MFDDGDFSADDGVGGLFGDDVGMAAVGELHVDGEAVLDGLGGSALMGETFSTTPAT